MNCFIDNDNLVYDSSGNLIGEFVNDGFFDFEGNQFFCTADSSGNAYDILLPMVVIQSTVLENKNYWWIAFPIVLIIIITYYTIRKPINL